MTQVGHRPVSLDFRLFSFWIGLPPGTGVTMDEMMAAVGATDPQIIRISLSRLRQGKAADPSVRGGRLRPLPVRWNSSDRKYYDLSNLSPDAVDAQIPGLVLSGAMAQLLTRASTLNSSLGEDGLIRSADQWLQDKDIRKLLEQVPLAEIWQVQDHLREIARARELLSLPPKRRQQMLGRGASTNP